MSLRLTEKQVIEKANKVHNNRYGYGNLQYKSFHESITVNCSLHGEFNQSLANHLAGKGCPTCKFEKLSNLYKSSKEEFIKKATAIHGNKYDYSKFIYKNNSSKSIIRCLKHGEFEQTANSHLYKKAGCPKCSKVYQYDTLEFIKRANIIHKNLYDYSDFEYINSQTKGIIQCFKHGKFKQTPNKHLQGRGCPICKASKGELAIKAVLDKHNIKYVQEYIIPEVVSLLKYDFYLSDLNVLIEFHGKQHYEYIPFLHGYNELNFLSQKERDIIKKDHAYRFKYNLLEFNYKQFKHISEAEFETLVINSILTSKR